MSSKQKVRGHEKMNIFPVKIVQEKRMRFKHDFVDAVRDRFDTSDLNGTNYFRSRAGKARSARSYSVGRGGISL